MKIQLKLYGSSELLSGKGVLSINLPKNSKIKNLRSSLMNLIVKKKLKNNLGDVSWAHNLEHIFKFFDIYYKKIRDFKKIY